MTINSHTTYTLHGQATAARRHTRLRVIVACILLIVSALCAVSINAKSPEQYVQSSALTTGKWVKIRVDRTGMQTLTYARLRTMGFSDPSKVNVYGYGGRMISDLLNDKQNDDLPQLPVVRTGDAILFYGVSTLAQSATADAYGLRPHVQQAYSDESYYFLSDRPAEDIVPSTVQHLPLEGQATVDSFRQIIVDDRDLSLFSYMTRCMVSDDFRATTTRTYPFELTDKAGDEVDVVVNFATNTSSTSRLSVTAGDKVLDSSLALGAIASEGVMKSTKKRWRFNHEDGKLSLRLAFQGGGVIKKANLDYIEVHYQRALRIGESHLVFDISSSGGTNVKVAGATGQTRIWDVTNPGYPVEVQYELSGSEAVFYSPSGVNEYVAFNPVATSLQPVSAGAIANQDIHSLPTPDMLIISPAEYMQASERLAKLHRDADGMIVHILTPEQLYNEFSSGTRDLSAFRKALKMWYDRGEQDGHSIKYCVLMGRTSNDCKSLKATADGITYPVMLSWQNYSDGGTGESELSAFTTDDYIAMLDNNYTNTFTIGREKVRVAVGRFPVKTAAEANAAVDKLERYMLSPKYGSWRNRFLIISDNADGGRHLQQGEALYSGAQATPDGKSLKFERLYFDAYPLSYTASGKEYTQPRNIYYDLLDQGVMFIQYLGHGNTRGWSHERFMLWDDLTSLRNKHLPVIFAATCEFGRWDDTSVSGAENMWLNSNGGAIAFIGTTRKVYVDENGNLVRELAKHTFKRDNSGHTKRLGDFLIEGKNGLNTSSDQRFRYNIIGDPALKMLFHENRTTVDEITGADTDANGYPVVHARSKFKVKGSIRDFDGNLLPDFNGMVEVSLLDAEQVIQTFGEPGEDGNDGNVDLYNDRKTILYTGKTTVTDGTFELQIAMPAEVDNNYSPALLSMYAYAADGREANGAFDEFYVYGFDENAEEDNEGPTIERFTLNGDNFTSGDVTHTNPVVYATVSDPSGINLSQGGLGHKLSLMLDERTVIDNLTSAYTPDPTDFTRGSLAYVLPTLEPGDHSLKLTVWDNANNSSSATIYFKAAVNRAPALYDVLAVTDQATSSVTFVLTHDRPESALTSTVEVFDLNGRRIWTGNTDAVSELDSGVQIQWDMTDKSGQRVPRGIYIYRATIVTAEGATATKSKKMAVAAPK